MPREVYSDLETRKGKMAIKDDPLNEGRLEIEIDLNNAAFHLDREGLAADVLDVEELRKIFNTILNELEEYGGMVDVVLVDSNGNSVGTARGGWEGEDPEEEEED